jgi:Pirin-related protein
MKINIHKADSRGYANHGWLESYHTFSFAKYVNPERMYFGALKVLNDDTIKPGKGFGNHPHENLEIITILLQGEMQHYGFDRKAGNASRWRCAAYVRRQRYVAHGLQSV